MIYDVVIRWKENGNTERVKIATDMSEDNEDIFFIGNPFYISKKEDFDVLIVIYKEDDDCVSVTLPKCTNCRNSNVEDMVDNGEFVDYLDALNLVNLFNDYGFKITNEMIYHNTTAWLRDYKSGYRGVNCHLFTPCGCNTLSFSASKLSNSNKSWQITYER